jgi:hypothetical protein
MAPEGGIQFDRLAVRSMSIGFRPRLLALVHGFAIGQALFGHQSFQGREPEFVIAATVIRLAAVVGGLQFIGERGGPFSGEMPLLGQLDREGEPGPATVRQIPGRHRRAEGAAAPPVAVPARRDQIGSR